MNASPDPVSDVPVSPNRGEPSPTGLEIAVVTNTRGDGTPHAYELEIEIAKLLNEGIRLCDERGDAGSRQILEELLRDTEDDHIDWLEAQLHLIGQIGIARYLSEQL